MDKIVDYVKAYGLSIFVIAVSIIAIIGLLKLCKVFNKIKSGDVKKCIYYALDLLLAFGGSAIYFATFGLDFSGYIAYSLAELTVVTTLYAIYEHFGVRKFVRWIISLIAGWIKTNPATKFGKLAKKIGLDVALVQVNEAIAKREAEEAEKKRIAEEAAKIAQQVGNTPTQSN